MKNLSALLAVFFMVISISSCHEDGPIPMIWEFADYNTEEITAAYTPDYYNQVQISAKPGYKGEITLKCTNFPIVTFLSWGTDKTLVNNECGYTLTKVSDNTVKISFSPISLPDNANEVSDFVGITGSNGKESSSTNMAISRRIADR